MKLGLVFAVASIFVYAQQMIVAPSPDRRANEGEGPFARLVIRAVTMIDGTGAPPRGPVDVVIEGNRIAEVRSVGYPLTPIRPQNRPDKGLKEIDGTGMFLLPGFVDLHVHTGGEPKAPEAEYVHKLWMAHGVTTVRGVPAGSMNWALREKQRSAENKIVSPRYFNYQRPFTGEGWKPNRIQTPENAREWVRWAKSHGIDGLKTRIPRPGDHGGTARRGEEERPREHGASRPDGRRADERP